MTSYIIPLAARRVCQIAVVILVGVACGDRHDPGADSVALAELIARESVPVLTPGRTAELRVNAEAVGGAFDSVFRARMEPVTLRLRGAEGAPAVIIDVDVRSLALTGDSAQVVVDRRGHYRADTARFSASQTRYRLAWQRDSGWRVTHTEPLTFTGEGVPPARARDLWWPDTGATRDSVSR